MDVLQPSFQYFYIFHYLQRQKLVCYVPGCQILNFFEYIRYILFTVHQKEVVASHEIFSL